MTLRQNSSYTWVAAKTWIRGASAMYGVYGVHLRMYLVRSSVYSVHSGE